MRVHVTSDDIFLALVSRRVCPIEMALGPFLRKPWIDWYVGPRWLHYGEEVVALPEEARAFIARYDAHLPVQPFSFDIDIPEQILKLDWLDRPAMDVPLKRVLVQRELVPA